MKRNLQLLFIAATCGLLVAGCAHRRVVVTERTTTYEPTGREVVYAEPPAPREEIIGKSPSADLVWVPGYWTYRHGRWEWASGHWASPPRTRAVWVPGHWDRMDRGWTWVPGRWD